MKIASKNRQERYDEGWVKWFAWYPVRVSDAKLAWLEYAERRCNWDIRKPYWEYRPLPAVSSKDDKTDARVNSEKSEPRLSSSGGGGGGYSGFIPGPVVSCPITYETKEYPSPDGSGAGGSFVAREYSQPCPENDERESEPGKGGDGFWSSDCQVPMGEWDIDPASMKIRRYRRNKREWMGHYRPLEKK